MNKAELKYYEFEYFSLRSDKVCSTIVRAYSFVSAVYAFNRPDEILSIRLLTDKGELNSVYGQEIKKPDIAALVEKIERNEKRINDLEIYYDKLRTRLNELWDNFIALKYDIEKDHKQC